MADFKVLRGSAIIASGSATLTLTEGTDFTLETGIASDAWFARINNSVKTGMGRTSGGGNQQAHNFSVSLSYSGDDIVFTRDGNSNDCRVDWEIIQYVGAAGGANEIKVREKGARDLSAGTALDTFALPGTVSNAADVVPFITGQRTAHNNRVWVVRMLFTSDISGSNVVFEKGDDRDDSAVSYAIVEFTGSAWNVQKATLDRSNTASEAITLGTTLSDYTKAFIHPTYLYRNTGTTGLDDAQERVRLINNTQLEVTAGSSSSRDGEHIIWVVENAGLEVNEYTGTLNGGSEEQVTDLAITTVGDLDQASVMVSAYFSAGNINFPRGFLNAIVLDDSTVRLRQSDSGDTATYSALVIEWPASSGTTYSASSSGLRAASGTGFAAGEFAGVVQGSSSGLRSEAQTGGAPADFVGAFSASAGGIRAAAGTGSAGAEFSDSTQSFTASAEGLRSSSRTGSADAELTGTFTVSAAGLRSASLTGVSAGEFNGTFGATSLGLRGQSRVGSSEASFSEDAQTFSATGQGMRSLARVGASLATFEAAFAAGAAGARASSGIGSSEATFDAIFEGIANGVRAASRVGSVGASLDVPNVYAASGIGVRSVSRIGATSAGVNTFVAGQNIRMYLGDTRII